MKKLNSWFEIDDKEYVWYILQGYNIIANEDRVTWRLNDLRHRTDGPAVIYSVGSQFCFLNGKYFTEEQYDEKNILRKKEQTLLSGI